MSHEPSEIDIIYNHGFSTSKHTVALTLFTCGPISASLALQYFEHFLAAARVSDQSSNVPPLYRLSLHYITSVRAEI